ncbi:Putative helix-turn-helix protein, copG family [Oxalobacteraceae bacterium IMCC9480]|nr:Putative helix-turn-helix protein, copG family [Oxalobacteraceae bacterium IMCC9480]
MSTLSEVPNKRETLNIRIKSEERSLIDRAASARGKNRTDFILDAARLAAEEVLIGQALIVASPAAYAQFLSKLDSPPNPSARLRKTLQTLPPWEQP